MVNRRCFIQAGSVAAAGALLPLVTPAPAFGMSKPVLRGPAKAAVPGDVFSSSSNFTPLLHSQFRVSRPGRSAVVTLTEVQDAPAAPGKAPLPCFSLLFRVTGAAPLPQAIYTVTHPALGTFAMFLSPVGRDPHARQAIINRRSS